MTVEERLKKELDLIESKDRLREIIITLSSALLNVKDFSTHLTMLRKRIEKEKNPEDAAYIRFLTLLLTLLLTNAAKRKVKQ